MMVDLFAYEKERREAREPGYYDPYTSEEEYEERDRGWLIAPNNFVSQSSFRE
jgi:hypothetical protein